VTGITNLSRRAFIASTGAATALVLGTHLVPRSLHARAGEFESAAPNVFVRIDRDGTVTLTCSRSEMGQGVRTGMPMILADELEADWNRVKIWQAPGDAEKYDPAGIDGQNTDGSRSTRHSFNAMRELGASARDVLERAAAKSWSVDRSEVFARNHRLHLKDTDESLDFGEVVDIAAGLDAQTDVRKLALKEPAEWKYIGKDMPVVDNVAMSTGRANYGADVRIPNLKIAVVARCPVYRGQVKSYDATAALEVPGVEHVIEIPAPGLDIPIEFRALGGIAVVGTNTWSVMQGRDKLSIEWDDGPFVGHDSATYDETLRAAARKGGKIVRSRGDVDAAFNKADRIVESEYFVPYFAHTTMEPPAAVVDATSKPVRVWAATQAPMETRQYVAEALGVDQSNVQCEVTLLGGGFGRKSKCDFSYEAALISKQVNAPVRIQWTREDDVRNGFYHAASAQHLKAGLDKDGRVVAWQQSAAWPSFFSLWDAARLDPSELEMGLGLIDLPYNNIPNIRIETGEAEAKIRIGWYRSVNNIQHAFAMNGFVAELASAAERDFLDVMLELIGDAEVMDVTKEDVVDFWNYGDSVEDWPIMPKRLSNALRVVAAKSGYGKTDFPNGQAIGLACHRSFHSYVATAVRAEIDAKGELRVPRVDVAIDCGRYVNPEGIRKQIEGATVFAHSVARHGRITVKNGAVEQSNFHDYTLSRMSDAPLDVRVHLIEDFKHLRPCGVGEPGVPPYSPALANAIYSITGKRLKSLPLKFA